MNIILFQITFSSPSIFSCTWGTARTMQDVRHRSISTPVAAGRDIHQDSGSPLSMHVIELYFFSPLKLDKATWLVLSDEIWVNIHLFCLEAFGYSSRLSHIPFSWPWLLTTLQTVGAINLGGWVRTKLQFPASPSKLPKRSQKINLGYFKPLTIWCYVLSLHILMIQPFYRWKWKKCTGTDLFIKTQITNNALQNLLIPECAIKEPFRGCCSQSSPLDPLPAPWPVGTSPPTIYLNVAAETSPLVSHPESPPLDSRKPDYYALQHQRGTRKPIQLSPQPLGTTKIGK